MEYFVLVSVNKVILFITKDEYILFTIINQWNYLAENWSLRVSWECCWGVTESLPLTKIRSVWNVWSEQKILTGSVISFTSCTVFLQSHDSFCIVTTVTDVTWSFLSLDGCVWCLLWPSHRLHGSVTDWSSCFYWLIDSVTAILNCITLWQIDYAAATLMSLLLDRCNTWPSHSFHRSVTDC